MAALVELSESSPYEVGHGIPVLIETLRQCTAGRLGGDAGGMVRIWPRARTLPHSSQRLKD